MTLFIISFLAGALTIFAPCILPVIPFVFSKIDQPFAKTGLPILTGMALTFAVVGSLGAVTGNWAIEANEYGRIAAISLLALVGATLAFPRFSERLTRPLVALGSHLSNAATSRLQGTKSLVLSSLVLGVATGLLWAPCAGPILGLILTGAALQGPSVQTSLLLLAYAFGATTSLALVLLVGGRLFSGAKRLLGIGEWFRRGLGIAVLAGVAAVALGFDTGWLAQFSSDGVGVHFEKTLLQRFVPQQPNRSPLAALEKQTGKENYEGSFMKVQTLRNQPQLDLPVEGVFPPLTGAVAWLNSQPLTTEELRGKVVLVDFWTFGCINCRNALPYVRDWYQKYKDQGFIVVSVHAPEFAYEKRIDNVRRAANELGVNFPIAIDNNFAIWKAFNNNYWPAHYFIDARGRVRFHHFGEGEYEKSERVIKQLIDEASKENRPV